MGECKICSQYIVSGCCCKMQDVNFVIMKKQNKKQTNKKLKTTVGIDLICCERCACKSERHRDRLRQAERQTEYADVHAHTHNMCVYAHPHAPCTCVCVSVCCFK